MHTTWELDRAGDPSDLGSSAKNRCHCRNGNGAYGTHENYETDGIRRLGEGRRQVRIRAWADRPRAQAIPLRDGPMNLMRDEFNRGMLIG